MVRQAGEVDRFADQHVTYDTWLSKLSESIILYYCFSAVKEARLRGFINLISRSPIFPGCVKVNPKWNERKSILIYYPYSTFSDLRQYHDEIILKWLYWELCVSFTHQEEGFVANYVLLYTIWTGPCLKSALAQRFVFVFHTVTFTLQIFTS